MPYVLDTDTITALQQLDPSVLARVQALPRTDIFVTIVSYQEQMEGRLGTLNRQFRPVPLIVAYEKLAQTLFYYKGASVLAHDNLAARIDNDLRTKLRRMGTKDRRIAAITLAHGHTLVTRNTVDFKDVPELDLEDWMAPDAPM